MNKSIKLLFVVMVASLGIAWLWNHLPIISQTAHTILDPILLPLLNWNSTWGIMIFSAAIALFITLVQKYTTDQETLREIKKEQKLLQKQMKEYREHPDKIMELNKKSLELIPRMYEITLRPLIFTSLPIIIFIRWMFDYFSENSVEIFGFISGFWAYFLFSIIFSIIFRKVFDVA